MSQFLVFVMMLSGLIGAANAGEFENVDEGRIQVAGFWGELGNAFGQMGDDFKDAVTGNAEKESSNDVVDGGLNQQEPTVVTPKAEGPVDIAEIQSRLTALGFSPGPVDGAFGRKTESAIEAFQARNGLAVDGRPSNELMVALRTSMQGPAEDDGLLRAVATGISAFVGARTGSPELSRVVVNSAASAVSASPGSSTALANQVGAASSGNLTALSRQLAVQQPTIGQGVGISQNQLLNLATSQLAGQAHVGGSAGQALVQQQIARSAAGLSTSDQIAMVNSLPSTAAGRNCVFRTNVTAHSD